MTDECVGIMVELASTVPTAMATAFDESEARGLPDVQELREHLLGPVEENCRATLALLG